MNQTLAFQINQESVRTRWYQMECHIPTSLLSIWGIIELNATVSLRALKENPMYKSLYSKACILQSLHINA